jgi:hypothetical protein
MLHIRHPTPAQSKKGGEIPCLNKKNNTNQREHNHETNNIDGESTLKTTMMTTVTMK